MSRTQVSTRMPVFSTRKAADRWLRLLCKEDPESYELLIASVLEVHDFHADILSDKEVKHRQEVHAALYGA